MEPMTTAYQPPLRGAVLFAMGLGRGAVTAETLAELAQVATDRARAFASILVAREALTETPQGYVPGSAWKVWSSRPSRARPHQTSDRQVIAEMDTMRRSMAARVRDEMRSRGWSVVEMGRRSGIDHRCISKLTRWSIPPPATALIVLARTLDLSVEDLVAIPAAPGAQFRR